MHWRIFKKYSGDGAPKLQISVPCCGRTCPEFCYFSNALLAKKGSSVTRCALECTRNPCRNANGHIHPSSGAHRALSLALALQNSIHFRKTKPFDLLGFMGIELY